MHNRYEAYLDKWLDGLYDEISYWRALLQGKYEESCRLQESSDPNKRFTLEDELPDDRNRHIKFVDVGSGAFSRCGIVSEKADLEVMAVDPLAEAYRALKKEFGVENGIKLETGFVELLDKQFEKDTFDIVHMSNSLDHCFDAVFGIYQLLFICKIGGKVILRHHENEADKGGYQGLHQWNLSLHNEENSFVIWNKEEKFDICEMFGEYADIKLYPDIREEETGWIYNKVVMIKKKDIAIPPNNYYGSILKSIYGHLVKILSDNVSLNVGNKKTVHNKLLCERMEKVGPNLLRNQIRSDEVVIYGLGMAGQRLLDLLTAAGVEVKGIMDKGKAAYKEYQSVLPKAPEGVEKNVPVIVTVSNEFSAIRQELGLLGWRNVCDLEETIGSAEEKAVSFGKEDRQT